MKHLFLTKLFLLALLFPGIAAAQEGGAPLADRVPRDALFYAGWAGLEEVSDLAEGSHAEALIEASELRMLFEQTLPKLADVLGRRNPDSRPTMKFLTEVYPLLVRHPTAVAFGGVDWTSGDQPLPRILIICDAGEDAPILRNKLADYFAMIRRIELIGLMDVQDGVVYLSLGWQKLDLAMAGDDAASALSSDDRFTSAMQGLMERPASALFIDTPGLMRFAEEAARRDRGEPGVQDLNKFLDATGLRGLGSIAAATGFHDRRHLTAAFVETRGARTGLLGLLEPEPVDSGLLERIPADAGFVAAGRLDLSGLLEALRNAVLVTDPDNVGNLEQGLRFINLLVGADIEKDLLDAMGPTWAAYTAPVTGDTALGLVAINQPEAPDRAEAALRNVWLSTISLINQGQRQKGEDFRLTGRTVEAPEGDIEYFDLPLVAPAWGTDDALIYFGLYPHNVASARSVASGAESFADSQAFAAVRELAGDRPIRGFTYIDLPRYGGRAHAQINAWLQLGSGVLSGFGETQNITARVPPMTLPPYHVVREHLSPAINVTWVDERGLHLRALEPFPFSGILAIGMQ